MIIEDVRTYNQYRVIRLLGFTQNCIDILTDKGQRGGLTRRQVKELRHNLIAIRDLGCEVHYELS